MSDLPEIISIHKDKVYAFVSARLECRIPEQKYISYSEHHGKFRLVQAGINGNGLAVMPLPDEGVTMRDWDPQYTETDRIRQLFGDDICMKIVELERTRMSQVAVWFIEKYEEARFSIILWKQAQVKVANLNAFLEALDDLDKSYTKSIETLKKTYEKFTAKK